MAGLDASRYRLKALRSAFREVLIILVASAIVVAGVRIFGHHHGWNDTPESSTKKDKLEVGGRLADLSGHGKRGLILVTSPTCRWCLQSVGFHRRLIEEATRRGLWVRVLVQDSESAKDLLNDLGATAETIQHWSAFEKRFSGTPTVAFVDESGIIRGTWVGKLPNKVEEGVFLWFASEKWPLDQKLFGYVDDLGVPQFSEEELGKQRMREQVQVIDIRERQQATLRGTSIVMPTDEIQVRASFELSPSSLQVVDCRAVPETKCRSAIVLLKKGGFKTAILGAGISETYCEMSPLGERPENAEPPAAR